MFETSNPNDQTRPNSRPVPHKSKKVVFKTLEDLGKWIDLQLEDLEAQHRDYQTSESNRNYFER